MVFGGALASGGFANDVWRLNLKDMKWAHLELEGSPPGRQGHSAVVDQEKGSMIVFGGLGSGSGPGLEYFNDVWALDLKTMTWAQLETEGPPSAREGHSAVVDQQKGSMILFGGAQGGRAGHANDLWALDLKSLMWAQLEPEGPPPARNNHAAVIDPEPEPYLEILYKTC